LHLYLRISESRFKQLCNFCCTHCHVLPILVCLKSDYCATAAAQLSITLSMS
jgi:hypothetical protein